MNFNNFANRVDCLVRKSTPAARPTKLENAVRWVGHSSAAQLMDCFGIAILTMHVSGAPTQHTEFRIDDAEVDIVATSISAFLGGTGAQR